MELHKLIQNGNYIDTFKKEKLIYRHYKSDGLLICKYKYGDNNFENKWKRYCRGVIIDTQTNQLVCVPPLKSHIITNLNDIDNISNYKIQNLIDGTMVNLFFHNNEWKISTRSGIGGLNKWYGTKTFKEMFFESGGSLIDYNLLNKRFSYSFVLLNKSNRNISYIYNNTIVLVDVFDLDKLEYVDIQDIPELNFNKIENIEVNIPLKEYITSKLPLNNFDFNWKGITIKYNGNRLKLINHNFDKIKNIKGNSNNLLNIYCNLIKNGSLNNYLLYFPEHRDKMHKYSRINKHILSEIHSSYISKFITKEKEIKDINFPLRPCIFELHDIYKSTKNKIKYNTVEQYFKNLPINKQMFIYSYYNN